MRWLTTALAATAVTGHRRWQRFGAVAVATVLGFAVAGGGQAALRAKTSVYTGYGFDTCNAPPTATLEAWLASPYRALGIYIGGANRTCANAQLSADWVASAEATGWNLLPLYVGLQAPCSTRDRAKISAATASGQGIAAADDAIAHAAAIGLPAGSPIYFDMESYAVNNATCSQTVLTFVSGWVTELHAQGYVAGVYGSAASTIRDLEALGSTSSAPDNVWIADWNGQPDVFGSSYVTDTFWTNHQRLHQYKGGHKETYGGVTINIDSDYVDAAVVGATGSPTPAPTPAPQGASPAGSVGSGDGQATVSWPSATFQQSVVVTLTPSTLTEGVPGFGSGGYTLQLLVQQTTTSVLTPTFAAPLTIHIAPQPDNLVPLFSTNGASWQPLPQLVDSGLPDGAKTGYAREQDGSIDIQTMRVGYFALLPDTTRPPAPASLDGRFSHGSLLLNWPKTTDNTGPAVAYQVTLTNQPLLSVAGKTAASLRAFHAHRPSVYRVVAIDAAGNASGPSKPVVVLPARRPSRLPKAIPAWAFELFNWQQQGKQGPRPTAPRIVPSWYWRWAAWRSGPFRIRPY